MNTTRWFILGERPMRPLRCHGPGGDLLAALFVIAATAEIPARWRRGGPQLPSTDEQLTHPKAGCGGLGGRRDDRRGDAR
jgi:hypothetical protein